MDAKEQLKEDVRTGKVSVDRLIDLIFTLQNRITELEKKLAASPTPKLDESYSMKAEQKRQDAKNPNQRKSKKNKKRGRITTEEKIAQAERTEDVFPEGLDKSQCHLSHTRPVWRLENGRAVLVAYRIYRGPNNRYGKIPGAMGKSEFGQEIVVAIAFLVYNIGLSFDKVCLTLGFFQNLNLRKSQVDASLHQLARLWEDEFEILCSLLANSLVVHADETSWSLNSVWAFLSEKARVILFGVHKDADTLKKILDPATFQGLVVSDDAAVYENFTNSQKCWAHLIRKAIKLTLQDPNNAEYRRFADGLIEIYRKSCRVKADGRLGDAGRAKKIAELDDEIFELCGAVWAAELPKLVGPDDDYRLLANEVVRLMLNQELFAFVTAASVKQPNGETVKVGATNNEAERTLRKPAEARKTGRTNKTMVGARRQTILTSVLESLRLYLKQFTLANVIEEVNSWVAKGRSCFAKQLDKIKKSVPELPILDRLFAEGEPEVEPIASG
jgi:transposase